MEKARITQSDIARQVGMHVTTVSLALRDSPKLPVATRRRIQEAAKEMGYVPDPALRALVNYRRDVARSEVGETIAYLTHWTSCWGWQKDPAHAQFYEGACISAREMGYRIEHFWLGAEGMTHQRMSEILRARGIRGVIVATHSRENDEELRLCWERLCGVKIDFFPHRPQLPNVSNDQCGIARMAFRKARESGAKRIGLLMHRGWDRSVDRMWTAGFLVEQSLVDAEDRLPVCYFPEEFPRSAWQNETDVDVCIEPEAFRRWFEENRPDAIIGGRGFLREVFREGMLEVPRDVGLIDLFLVEDDGETAGVLQNHRAVGASAMQMLAGRLMRNCLGVETFGKTTFIEGTWVRGRSLPVLEGASAALPRGAGAG